MTQESRVLDHAEDLGRFHVAAIRLDRPGEFMLRAGEVVPIASMFKVLLALEVAEAFEDGRLSAQTEVRVDADAHCPGGLGLNQLAHRVTISMFDLLYLSLAWSDNTASDLLLDSVGIDAVRRRALDLELGTVALTGNCRQLLHAAGVDLGYASDAEAAAADWAPRSDTADFVIDRVPRASSQDLLRLACLIDADAAAGLAACRTVKALMARQIWTTRFASAFPRPRWALWSKTGTLSPWRGEIAVVRRSDGARVALAIVVRQHRASTTEAAMDAAVADVAKVAFQLATRSGPTEVLEGVPEARAQS